VIDSRGLERVAGGKPLRTFPQPALGRQIDIAIDASDCIRPPDETPVDSASLVGVADAIDVLELKLSSDDDVELAPLAPPPWWWW